MSVHALVVRYVAFAIVATVLNLGVQRLVFATMSGPWTIVFAMTAGTLSGLALKYVLDKRWIFNDTSTGLRAHGRNFSLYAAMGLFTTLVFWVTESVFWFTWKTDTMREVGAVIGLCIGYTLKYHLDRRFVFTNARQGRGRE